MNLNIELPPDTEAKLSEKAAAAGKDVDAFVLEVVVRTLNASATSPAAEDTSPDPFLGLLSDCPDLADYITESAMRRRVSTA